VGAKDGSPPRLPQGAPGLREPAFYGTANVMDGAKSKKDMKVTRTITAIFMVLAFHAFTGGAYAGQPDGRIPDFSQARSYTVVDKQDFSAGYGRTRIALCIASDAERFTARAHTAIRAAVDVQRDTGADYIQVAITPIAGIGCREHFTAVAEYAPDGGGITGDAQNRFWQVKATDIVLDLEERLVLRAWEESRSEFLTNGEVDMERMTQHLSKQLNLSPEAVENYYLQSVEMGISMRPYPAAGD